MVIDNSAANEFRTCPLKYYEVRVAQDGKGLEPKPKPGEYTPLELGSREHELMEEYYNELKGSPIAPYPIHENEALENEAQWIATSYRAKYPAEEFEIVDVERSFKVELPMLCQSCYQPAYQKDDFWYCYNCIDPFQNKGGTRHIYTGKIDVVLRNANGELGIMDHKTEKRRSQSNAPKKWAAKDQASLYIWAASHIYQEPIKFFLVNVLKRPSEKLEEGPTFPERQSLERTEEQIKIAVRDLVFIADDIERYKKTFKGSLWPSNREACVQGWGECEFYQPHTYGWSEEMIKYKFQPKSEYLFLENIEVTRSA